MLICQISMLLQVNEETVRLVMAQLVEHACCCTDSTGCIKPIEARAKLQYCVDVVGTLGNTSASTDMNSN